ncbi:MAG: hypothetical protein NT069_30445, partial [Planctomycetota bacterium]|nr:hypothetical protein [Planctomycetota bacterium]
MLTTRDVYGCQRVARGLLLVGVVAFSLLAQVNSVSAQVDLDFPDSSGENRAQSESISELQDRFDALSRSHKQLQSRLERVEAGQSTQSGLDSTEVKPAALQEWEDLDDVSPNPSGLPQITVDDGLSIHGPDDWYTFSFHTLIQAQYTEIVGQPANSPGGFTVPRQRLYFAGDVLGTVSHYTMLQWAYGNYNLLDTYIDLKLAPTVNLRFGHWRSPFLYEMSILPEDKLISTERSVANNTVIPERQTGVALFGSLWEGGVDYQFGVFNGPNHQVPDTNSAKDVIGLVDLKPFHFAPDDHPFKYLHFVGSLDYGRQNQSPPPVIQYRLNSELDNFGVSDGANQVSPPWLTFAPKSGTNGERFLWGFETVWLYNGWTAL